MEKKLKAWFNAVPVLKKISVSKPGDGSVIITSIYSMLNDSASVKINYTIRGDGLLKVSYFLDVKTGLPNLPKVGMQMGIAQADSNISSYARGPYENYIDRRTGSEAGTYSQPISQFMEPYVVPQENGNRTDVRWMLLHHKTGGLVVTADSLLSMSAWLYTEENIQKAKHTNKLQDAGFITLNIDLVQMGVGGNDSWSEVAEPLEQYHIPAKNYGYSFYLKTYQGKPDAAGKAAYQMKFNKTQ
jgi:beta-galactosidase